MKVKILLVAVFVAGIGASLAFADGGKPKEGTQTCNNVHLEGTGAPQTLTLTVSHSGPGGAVAPGTVVTLSVGSAGQTIRINAETCASGSSFVVKHAELQPMKPHEDEHGGSTSGTTTTKHGDDSGEHNGDKGGTTTSPTTTTTSTTP